MDVCVAAWGWTLNTLVILRLIKFRFAADAITRRSLDNTSRISFFFRRIITIITNLQLSRWYCCRFAFIPGNPMPARLWPQNDIWMQSVRMFEVIGLGWLKMHLNAEGRASSEVWVMEKSFQRKLDAHRRMRETQKQIPLIIIGSTNSFQHRSPSHSLSHSPKVQKLISPERKPRRRKRRLETRYWTPKRPVQRLREQMSLVERISAWNTDAHSPPREVAANFKKQPIRRIYESHTES